MNLEKISKTISYALRHNPEQFGLCLDDNGFCNVDDLLIGLKNNKISIDSDTLKEIVDSDEKGRYEIIDDKIRAVYGHSIKKEIIKKSSQPPEILYHGTTKSAFDQIMKSKLSHRSRQKVCLSANIETAEKVALRRTNNPFIIQVNAKQAFVDGINFYKEPNDIWQSDDIPSKYLKLIKIGEN